MIKKKHSKLISDTIDEQQARLGLLDWEISWTVGDRDSWTVTNNNAASVHYRRDGRVATIEISPFGRKKNLKGYIIHELLHLLLADLSCLTPEGISSDAQEHAIIRRLEKIL